MSRLPLTIGGKYAVTRLVGRGGMGAVYEAFGLDGGRVAIKVMAEDLALERTQVIRFEREARTVSALDTPHVVKVIEAGIDADTHLPFIAMEYLEGEDLRVVLRRVQRLPPATAVRVASQVCAALRAAHDAHVLHRDVKPANIFLTREGSRRTVKLLDFGIAKPAPGMRRDTDPGSLTNTGGMLGSPQYMSPEQARGSRKIDARADVWSLGVVLYQMLCGRIPHDTVEAIGDLIVVICTQPPEPLQDRAPWVSKEIAAVVHRALRMSPDERFPSSAAFFEALAALAPDGEIEDAGVRSPTDHEVAAIAERLPPEVLLDGPGRQSLAGLSGSTGSSATGPGGAQRRRTALRAGAAAFVFAGAGGLLYALSSPAPPASSGADIAPAAAPPVAVQTVQLAIAPPGAEVEVDGARVPVRDGLVALTGENGSVHVVRVSSGRASTTVEVVIAGLRSVPAKVEIAAKVSAGDAATRGEPAGTASSRVGPVGLRPPGPQPPGPQPPGPSSGSITSARGSAPLLRPTR